MSESKAYIKSLKQRVVNGDYSSLEKLYRIYFDKLRLYGYQISSSKNKHTVEDTIQELFIWIAKNTDKLSAIEDLEAYLFSAFKRNRQNENQNQRNKEISKDKYIKQTDYKGARIECSVETNYIAEEVKNASQQKVANLMNGLPTAQREVLYLRHFVDLNYKSIALIMGLNEQVVRNYAYRALQKLRSLDTHNLTLKNKRAD